MDVSKTFLIHTKIDSAKRGPAKEIEVYTGHIAKEVNENKKRRLRFDTRTAVWDSW
jgi:pyridoxine 5'-phosphate synthase PdxJ